MWKLEKRKRRITYEYSPREDWIDCETLVRDDGVSLMVMGGAPEKHLHFLYTDKTLSFDFRNEISGKRRAGGHGCQLGHGYLDCAARVSPQ